MACILKMRNITARLILIFICLLTTTEFSYAGVIMIGTRIIIKEDDKYGEVKLKNEGDKPQLIQVWIDNGEGSIKSTSESPPLIPTPSVFRIGAHSEQSVRINLLSSELPEDKESLYWFNFLQIFPKGEKATNSLDFSIINAVKVFYRPSKINSSSRDNSDYLRVKLDKRSKFLTLQNSSPYHINLAGNASYGNEKKCRLDFEGKIINPFSELRLRVKEIECNPKTLSLNIIDDDGRVSVKSLAIY